MRSVYSLFLLALSSQCFAAQSIVPSPRPGTVLWKRTVEITEPTYPPLIGPDGTLWAATWKGDIGVVATAFDPKTGVMITNGVPGFSSPQIRLKTAAAFLLDGTAIATSQSPEGGPVSAIGIHPWTTANFSRAEFGLATATGIYFFHSSPKDGTEKHLIALNSTTGETLYDRKVASGPGYVLCGFGPGGRALVIQEGPVGFLLVGYNTSTGARVFTKQFPKGLRPDAYLYNTTLHTRYRVATTEGGLIAIAVTLEGNPVNGSRAGVWITDPSSGSSGKIVVLGDEPTHVTGLVALRNGAVYVSLAEVSNTSPPVGGGIRGLDPLTGQVVVVADIPDAVHAAPVIGADGTLFAVGEAGAPYSHVTLYAVATGSVGGLAHSPWPRSTGDNLNSFREQGIEDSDGDGLTDEEENFTYHTNPTRADTDGDGYADGVEVRYGSDPKNRSDIPEIMEATIAVKLTFGTNLNQRYRLQSSSDLVTWTDEGTWFDGTGTKSTQLVEASKSHFYWRLVRLQ